MYIDEDGKTYTKDELMKFYEANKDEIAENSGAETFAEYLGNCLSKNGSLTEKDFYADLLLEQQEQM